MAQVSVFSFGSLRRTMVSLALTIAAVLLPCTSSSAADQPQEYQVQAVFILNFTKFIEWPAGSLGPSYATFNICVLGDDPFGSTLDQIVSGEVVYGRKMAVHRIDRQPEPGFCQILFAGPHDDDARILSKLGPGVLTVGEGQNFVRSGGMIGFVLDNRHVSFEINLPAAEAAGLRISSKLLTVAKSVMK
jgi:hypothetical protein